MIQEDILDYQESVMQLVSGMKRGGNVNKAYLLILIEKDKIMSKWIKKKWQKFIDWFFKGFYK